MILNQQQIEEIEAERPHLTVVANLIETVKDLQKKEQRARELLKRAVFYTNRIDSQAAQSLSEQIEDYLK